MGDSDEKKTNVPEAVAEIIKQVPVYQDAIQPGAQEVGKALKTVGQAINVALSPLSGLVWGYEKIGDYLKHALTEKLSNVPPDRIVSPQPYVVGPALEGLRYTAQVAELRDLYATLIACAMDSESRDRAHPSFAEMIKQLMPLEARMIRKMAHSPDSNWPLANVHAQLKKPRGSYRVAATNYCQLGISAGAKSYSEGAVAIDNLIRLRLVEIPVIAQLTDKSVYKEIEDSNDWKSLAEEIAKHDQFIGLKMDQRFLTLTPLGREFIDTCVDMNYSIVDPDSKAERPYTL